MSLVFTLGIWSLTKDIALLKATLVAWLKREFIKVNESAGIQHEALLSWLVECLKKQATFLNTLPSIIIFYEYIGQHYRSLY